MLQCPYSPLHTFFQTVHGQLPDEISQKYRKPVRVYCSAADASFGLPTIKITFVHSKTTGEKPRLIRHFRTEPYGFDGWRWTRNCSNHFIIKSSEPTPKSALGKVIDQVPYLGMSKIIHRPLNKYNVTITSDFEAETANHVQQQLRQMRYSV